MWVRLPPEGLKIRSLGVAELARLPTKQKVAGSTPARTTEFYVPVA